jgi:hypothetical protein
LTGQAEAGLDGFGGLGPGDRRGWRQPGHVQGGGTGSFADGGYVVRGHIAVPLTSWLFGIR